jgi:hypothetical protein
MKPSYPPSNPCTPSLLSIEPDGLGGLCSFLFVEDDAEPADFWEPSLKMCTVSWAELTANKVETTLKLMEYILASLVPRRNWYSFSAPGILQTRITVPLSEAVARRVPVELMERKDIGDLWACITFETVSERVEKMRTSPDCCCAEVDDGGAEAGWLASGVVGEGTGDG